MALYPNDQSNPAGAIPVWLAAQPGSTGLEVATTGSTALVAATAETVLAANPARRYLLIQCVAVPPVDIWMNMSGVDAVVGALGSVLISAGVTYESNTPPAGAVSLIAAVGTDVTVWEG